MGEDIEGGHVRWVGTLRGSCGEGEDVLGGYPGKFPKVLGFMKVSGKFNTYQKFLESFQLKVSRSFCKVSNQKFLESFQSKVSNQKFLESFQPKVSGMYPIQPEFINVYKFWQSL